MAILGARIYAVRRYRAGSVVDGRYVKGTYRTLNASISIGPASGEDIQSLPEGIRTQRIRVGYANVRLLTVDESTAKMCDVVIINGEEYDVQHVEEQTRIASLYHWKVLMTRRVK